MNDLAATKVIAVDWGTSSFRAYRLDHKGGILERKEALILEATRGPGFTVDALRKAMADGEDIH